MLLLRTVELAFYHLLICLVDRLSRLPRASIPPDTAVHLEQCVLPAVPIRH